MKGTTTVGVVCNDGIVLGADSRASMDTFLASSEAIKINRIDENLAMTIAGGVGDAEYLTKMLKAQNELYKMNEGKPLSPNAATSLLSIVLQENKMMPFMVQLIVGGFNGGTPELYSLDPLGGYIKESKFTSTGSGSPVALGYLEDVYEKAKTTTDMTKHVVKALKIAMKRDTATGDRIRLAIITKTGFKELSQQEVEQIAK
ncbi:MAG: proteasome subunit beta [Candidatus Micrarchaeota archaeon]|nr:proteasome subunit beta [Candidatus Micrarchaeota archaeon]MDE1804747.1 proteasome subunit beta [Candidatus Micrarchaeota archaeon]MDE1847209.1 proteasome subunit beta [Candidatus Micrarchaeota archaeon]